MIVVADLELPAVIVGLDGVAVMGPIGRAADILHRQCLTSGSSRAAAFRRPVRWFVVDRRQQHSPAALGPKSDCLPSGRSCLRGDFVAATENGFSTGYANATCAVAGFLPLWPVANDRRLVRRPFHQVQCGSSSSEASAAARPRAERCATGRRQPYLMAMKRRQKHKTPPVRAEMP